MHREGMYHRAAREFSVTDHGRVVYNVTSGCVTPLCIAIAPSTFGAMQIGHQIGAPLQMWSNVRLFRSPCVVKSDSPLVDIILGSIGRSDNDQCLLDGQQFR